MTWIRINADISHHPKFVEAGPVASWLWVCGVTACQRLGRLEISETELLTATGKEPSGASSKSIEALITADLIERLSDGNLRFKNDWPYFQHRVLSRPLSAVPRHVAERLRGQARRLFAKVFGGNVPRCVYCGATEGDFTVDHVVPISRGGDNTTNNLALACRSCNSRKGARTVSEFLQ